MHPSTLVHDRSFDTDGFSANCLGDFTHHRKHRRKAVFFELAPALVQPFSPQCPAQLSVKPAALTALSCMQSAGFQLIALTQQAPPMPRMLPEPVFAAAAKALSECLKRAQLRLTNLLFCPHAGLTQASSEASRCSCYQPHAGLILQAASDLGLNLKESWCISDHARGIAAARLAGCHTVLIGADGNTIWPSGLHRSAPDYVAPDLTAGVDLILHFSPRRGEWQAAGRLKGALAC